MIKNYLRVAYRALLKNKSYVIVNTLGLGISLSCCITAYLLLAYNIEFDNFYDAEKVSNVFRIHTHSTENSGKRVIDDQAPLVMAPIITEEIAGIDLYTRFLYGGGALRYEDKAFNERMIAFSDSSFFDMFEYPLVVGSHRSFKEKNSIFITEEIAKKYFGNEDPIGKIMVFNGVNETEIELIVGGVIKRFPANNSFTFKIMMRIENFNEMNKIAIDDWSDSHNPGTFVKLTSAENSQQIGKELGRYIQTQNKVHTDVIVDSYKLVPFISNFSQDDIRSYWANHRISIIPVALFTVMAALILLIACFNLTNTSIAMTAKRLKEVGIRKAIGAARAQIVIQFLFETLMIIFVALLVGLFVAQLIVPAFVNMWRLPYSQNDLDGLNLFIALVILVFLAALLAGMYPAIFSSKFKPTMLLNGNVKGIGANMLTKSLVAAQFAFSVIVLIAGVLFYLNSRYQDQIQFGYDKDQVITLNIMGDRDFEAMSNAIAGHPKIIEIAASEGNIGGSNYQFIQIDSNKHEVQAVSVGKNYFETMGLRFVEGRSFDVENSSDQMEGVVVNKAFVEKTGLHDPLEKTFILHDQKRTILGVIDNHVDNVHRSKDPEPFVFYPTKKSKYVLMLVKGEKEDLPEIKGYLEKTWKGVFPTKPFESQLQDEAVMGRGREINANFKKIFLFITALGGLLSAAGIYALASLNIARRIKEIGIRKVLGASIGSILTLLNREFVIVLSVAAVVGSLVGFFVTDTLLRLVSVFHIPVGIIPVMTCALVIFGIGILTTSATILKAARSNPVDTLRTE
jgi:putative ABC transport system permease protein